MIQETILEHLEKQINRLVQISTLRSSHVYHAYYIPDRSTDSEHHHTVVVDLSGENILVRFYRRHRQRSHDLVFVERFYEYADPGVLYRLAQTIADFLQNGNKPNTQTWIG